jgi:hypothetical protein
MGSNFQSLFVRSDIWQTGGKRQPHFVNCSVKLKKASQKLVKILGQFLFFLGFCRKLPISGTPNSGT